MTNFLIVRKDKAAWLLGVIFVLWLFIAVPSTTAQTTYGSILGTVTDPSGAVVPGVEVVLIDTGRSTQRTTMTNGAGLYQFFNLPPASYRLEVSHPGFERLARGPLVLQTQSTLKIDIKLIVGSQAQTIRVSGQTPLLQPETSSLGQVIDQRETNELPLNGRNPMNLAALVPSVVPQSGALNAPNGQNPFAWGNYQIGGGFANQSSTYLDGSPVNAEYLNVTGLVPTQDSIGEFKVTTNNLSPEYGRLAGGVIAFSTKSGTNQLHGSFWEFLRNRALNANDYFSNQAGIGRPAFTQNQFGLDIGGPVYIPHIYNGHSKTFFFFSWEDFQLRQGQTFVDTFPTAAERTGNLSGLGVPIYDPLTTCGTSDNPVCPPGTPQYSRTQFPGNVIPTDRLNPVALKVISMYYPLPNTPGVNGQNNFITHTSAGGSTNEFVGHLDHNFSDKDHLSARYTYWDNYVLPNDPLRDGQCVGTCSQTFNTNNFVIGDSYTFNPTMVLDSHVSYQRFTYLLTPELMPFDLSKLGLPSSLNTQLQFDMPPLFGVAGIDQAGINSGGVINDFSDNDRIASSLTKIINKQVLKFGFDYSFGTYNIIQSGAGSAGFSFDQGFTSSNPLSPVGGAGLASFLLGYPSGGSTPYANMVAASQKWGGLFANDDWHVSNNLTLNLGLRWEYDGPWTERHNRLSYFDPEAVNPLLKAADLNYPGSVELVDSGNYHQRSNIRPDWKQFSPRIGFAYQPSAWTVLHGGYGILWLPTDLSNAASPNTDSINSISTSYIASTDGGFTPANSISNPFPQGILTPPGRNADFQNILLGEGVVENSPGTPYGYAQQWNFGLQQQFGNSVVLDIAYGGAKGTHLPFYQLQIDQLPDKDLSLGSQLLEQVPNPFYGVISSTSALGTPTISYGQLLRPFPQYNGVYTAAAGVGDSTYNSLQVKVIKRFTSGASILGAYTHAKLISDTDTQTAWLEPSVGSSFGGLQDNNNLSGEKSLSSQDTPNRLVVAYVYDLPFGHGERFLASSGPLINAVLEGWGVEGTTTLMTGFPLALHTSENLTNSFGGGSRPNVVPGCNKAVSGAAVSRLDRWFNTSCFTQPPIFTFGNESRNDSELRAPGVANWDFATFKTIPIVPDGKASLQFRAEFFNLFNRVQFGYPSTTQGLANFGFVSSQINNPRLIQFALRLSY